MNTKPDKSNLTGIILTGGKSSRMGEDKGLMDFDGKRLIEYPIQLLSLFCDNILISANNDQYQEFGFPTIADGYAGMGPAAGMIASLKHSKTTWNLIVGCDMPFLEVEFIAELLEKLKSINAGYCSNDLNNNIITVFGKLADFAGDFSTGSISCLVPVHDEKIEPLAALYHKSFSDQLETGLRTNQRALYQTIRKSNVSYFDVGPQLSKYPNLFVNINDKEELQYWKEKTGLTE